MELSTAVPLGPKIWPICLPNSPNPNPNHLSRFSATLVGYGPGKDDSTDVNQLKLKVEPQNVCARRYDPNNAELNFRQRIKSTLPNMFEDR